MFSREICLMVIKIILPSFFGILSSLSAPAVDLYTTLNAKYQPL